MAFNINEGRQQFTASSSQTIFNFNFCIFTDTDLKVYKTPVGQTPDDTADLLAIGTNYSVSINGTSGGTVTLTSGATLNDVITIVRDLPITRTTDYQSNGDLYADTLDIDQDYQTYLIQDRQNELNRAVLLPNTVAPNVSVTIPNPIADAYFKWNSTANAIENDTTIPTNVTLSEQYKDEAESARDLALTYRNEAEGFRDEAKTFADSIDPSQFVKLTTAQTINGIKTFGSFPLTPSSAPTTDYQVANKKYADNLWKQPAFSAYKTGTQDISANTSTKIAINAEEYDYGSMYDVATNYRFQPNVAGVYSICATISFSAPTTGAIVAVPSIYKNGVDYKRGNVLAFTVNTVPYGVTISCNVVLNGSTDYIELYVFTSVGSTVNQGATQTWLQGHYSRSNV